MDAVAHLSLHTSEACQAAVQVVRTLRSAGHSAYLVGGCVRDLVLGLDPKDYDVATSASPAQTRALFRHVVEVGVAFGVLRVRLAGAHSGTPIETEVATFRADVGHGDGRRPNAVRFTDAREDVLRRDFTLNGLLLDPLDERGEVSQECLVVDWVSGLDDLRAGILRAIGEPALRFEEDALRLLRAPRFAARFGLTVHAETAAAIRAAAPTLLRVSAERIGSELGLMLTGPDAVRALGLLVDLGLAQTLWPSLCAADPALQACQARFGTLGRELTAIAAQPAQGGFEPETRLSLGVAVAALWWPLRAHFKTTDLARQWRLSNAQAQRLHDAWSLADAMAPWMRAPPDLTPALVRLLRHPDADAALLLLLASATAPGDVQVLRELRRLRAATQRDVWFPTPAIGGEELKSLGFEPGPSFRAALQAAEDVQLQGGDAAGSLAAALAVLAQAHDDKRS